MFAEPMEMIVMKENEILIRNLVDNVLLNAFSIQNSGLFNGKSGFSLALFMASDFLDDCYFRDKAFELLKESLLTKTDDISFENGLSGIGYVLLYAVSNNYIEADFEEVFGDKFSKILESFDYNRNNTTFMLGALRVNYFLTKVKKTLNKDTYGLICRIFSCVENYLSVQFYKISNKNSLINKRYVVSLFERYLEVVCNSNYSGISKTLIDEYAHAYRKGVLCSSYVIGYYLEKIDSNYVYLDESNKNKQSVLLNYDKRFISLSDSIFISKDMCNNQYLSIDLNSSMEEIETSIFNSVPNGRLISGYEHGISRLICHLSNSEMLLV